MSFPATTAVCSDGTRTAGAVVRAVAVLLALLIMFAWDRVVLAVSLPELKVALGLGSHQLGFIATIFTAGVALAAVPAGVLIRKFGLRPALVGSALVFSVATAYPPLARGFGDLLVSRIFVGLGEGVFHVAVLLYLASLSVRHRAAVIGLAATIYGLGATTGPLVITYFNAATGDWRTSYYVLAAAGVVLAVIARQTVGDATVERSHLDNGWESHWAPIRRSWPLLLLIASQGLALYSVVGLLPTWTRANFGFSPGEAALALSAAGFGMMVGGAPMGLIADRLPRVSYLIGAGCISGASAVVLMAANFGPLIAVGLAFVFGVAAQTLYVTAIVQAQSEARADATSLVGLIVTIFYGSASISGFVLTQMSEWFGPQHGAVLTYVTLYGCGILGFALFERRSRNPQLKIT